MSVVIGLHGAKGVGKDEFFRIAQQSFPLHDIRKIAYADPIKEEVCRIFGLSSEQEYDRFKRVDLNFNLSGDDCNVEGRRVVREIGMMMRNYDEGQFVRYVEQQIEKYPGAIWCITDLRFENELKSINKLGGIVVKIIRQGISYDGHVTETEFPDNVCDYIIHNKTNLLKQYQQDVRSTMESIFTFAPRAINL